MAAGTIIGVITTEGDDPAAVLTHLRRLAAQWRLSELGVRPEQAEGLISSEPDLGDRWLAYLALAPISVIDDLIRGDWH